MGFCCFGAFDSSPKKSREQEEEIGTSDVKLFSYNSLRSATNLFHPSNKVGGGGFGVVYRGILRDGMRAAIKILSSESKQGTREFLTEINMISTVKHPNLVQLIGCCVEDKNRILLYEYMENNSLASVLLRSKGKGVHLDWPKRVTICMGTASGLAFLHEEANPQIVHRDIKASNILLDGNFHPKIGDFGLAKLFPDNVTHISTRVAGTVLIAQVSSIQFLNTVNRVRNGGIQSVATFRMGYLAPEYAMLGQLTKKADVYSFGVLILEIISGRSSSTAAFGEDLLVLVEWAWQLKEQERLLDLVDPELTEYPAAEMLRFIKVALFCTQAASNQRPSMKQVLDMLSKEVNLNEKLLTEAGVYRRYTQHTGGNMVTKGNKQSNPSVSSNHLDSFQSVTTILPR